MTASPATTAARPAEPGRGAAKILLVVLGSLGALLAMALVVAGVVLVVAHTQRDAAGFLSTPTERFASRSYALTHEGVEVGDATSTPTWVVDRIGTIRVRATSGDDRPLFVGIGRAAAVSRYLAGVAHDEVTHLDYDPFAITKHRSAGTHSPATPSQQSFWVASAIGPGTQTVEWKIDDGSWSLVLMNADASRAVAADVQFGAKAGWLLWAGLALGTVGLLIGAGSAAMIVYGAGGGGSGAAVAGAREAPSHSTRDRPKRPIPSPLRPTSTSRSAAGAGSSSGSSRSRTSSCWRSCGSRSLC